MYAAGESGTLIVSIDGGETWAQKSVATSRRLNAIYVVDKGGFVAVGQEGVLCRAEPDLLEISCEQTEEQLDLRGIEGDNRGGLYLAGENSSLRYIDAGGNIKRPPNGIWHHYTAVAAMAGRVYLTEENGDIDTLGQDSLELTRIFHNTLSGRGLNAIWADPHGGLIAVGRGGWILRSPDANKNWHELQRGSPETLSSLWVTGAGHIYAAGARGTLLRSRVGQERWEKIHLKADIDINGIWVGDREEIFAVASDRLVLIDGASSQIKTLRKGSFRDGLQAIWGHGKDIYAVGNSILHSSDSGESWSLQMDDAKLAAVWGTGPLDVFAVGYDGRILHTTDRGESWQRQNSGTVRDLKSIWGDGSNIYVAGQGETILLSQNRGNTWIPMMSGGVDDFNAIWSSGNSRLYVATSAGRVLHSSDRGLSWAREHSGAWGLNALAGSQEGDIFAAGAWGAIVHRRRRSP